MRSSCNRGDANGAVTPGPANVLRTAFVPLYPVFACGVPRGFWSRTKRRQR